MGLLLFAMANIPSTTKLRTILENPRPITVALYFRSSDVSALWDLASRHWPDADDISTFAKAARATERGLPIVVECHLREELQEIAAFFARYGIEPPRIEELRI